MKRQQGIEKCNTTKKVSDDINFFLEIKATKIQSSPVSGYRRDYFLLAKMTKSKTEEENSKITYKDIPTQ